MSCEHKRVVHLYGKHNDLAEMDIPHLGIKIDGYLPSLGLLGGDEVSLNICLDCGQIMNWVPITDEMIKSDEEIAERLERQQRAAKREAAQQAKRKKDWAAEKTEITLHDIQVQAATDLIVKTLVDNFGSGWTTSADVLELLEDAASNGTDPASRDAAAQLLQKHFKRVVSRAD